MPEQNFEGTRLVATFLQAWVNRDIDRALALLTDDVVFGATAGSEPGTTYRGMESVRAAIAPLILSSDIRLQVEAIHGDDSTVFVIWHSQNSKAPPSQSHMKGVDVFRLRHGKICLKDAYRKVY